MIYARAFREGDTVRGEFRSGWAVAEVEYVDRHSDARAFVDAAGRDLGPIVGEWQSVESGHS